MSSHEFLGNERIGKLLIKYSIPAIVGMMVTSFYNIVDRIFIGNIPGVGPLAITGLGVTMPVMTVILAFGLLIGIGTTTIVSIKLGEGDRETARRLIGNAMVVSFSVSIVITVVGLLFLDKILYLFGASEATIVYATEYSFIILLGTVFSLMSFSLNHSIRADGAPAISAGIMVAGCLTNIVLDYIFIFKFGMGIKGAAIATVISQVLSTVLTVGYYVSGMSNLKFEFKDLRFSPHLTKLVFSVGMAPFAMQVAISVSQTLTNNALKIQGGDLAIGAMTAITSIVMIFLMPVFGINQGSQPIIGYNYGAKKFDRVKKTYLGTVAVATVILIVGFLLTRAIPDKLISVFNSDPHLLKIATKGLKIDLSCIFVAGISITGSNFMQSIGKAKFSLFLSLLRQVLVLIPCLLILPKFFGLNGVWASQPTGDVISSIVTVFVLVSEFRLQSRQAKENYVKGE